MRKNVNLLLALCLVGTSIAIVGAVLRTSNLQEREEWGVFIHRIGMTVMLMGFAGLFMLRQNKSRKKKSKEFQWSDANGNFTVIPADRNEILDLSVIQQSSSPLPNIDTSKLVHVRCVIANGRTIHREFISRLAKIQKLRVLDLQNAILDEDAIQELEALESLEVILLAGCLVPSQSKELQIALPETKFIFDPRIFQA